MAKDLGELTTDELGQLFPIIIVDYNPEWPGMALTERNNIINAVGEERIFRIEHIGSTAVPGLCAKPTIDFLLEVLDITNCDLLIKQLREIGFHYIPRPENPAPHMMFAKGYSESGITGQTFHIHIRYPGDWDEAVFRDYLIKNRGAAEEYAKLKRKLAGEFKNDREKYTECKTEFIKRTTMTARNKSKPMSINTHTFENSWGNRTRAESYARLEFPNTYYLAYRDLPQIISSHVTGKKAVDFGCGTGRSTRFLKNLGFKVTGIDISPDMLDIARQLDKSDDYQLVTNGQYSHLGENQYDLVQSIFTFDNIPGWENRTNILTGLRDLLNSTGKIICLDSTPDLYTNEWASFSTNEFPGNRTAKTGDIVRDIMLDVEDRRPVEDIYWTVEDYHLLFTKAGLILDATYKPLGKPDEPYNWISELNIAPWMIFVLSKK